MAQTAAFCRAQAAIQRERANGATLENVRSIAVSAAVAWSREAGLAEEREAKRHVEVRLPEPVSDCEEQEDRLASENPDRGVASVA
ncbi:hypothetical protein [Sphingobium nicotianae]|uniref:Uncharacterized protein n=1 Tax=Sphingobium nicotianae TaxID=2782607 RepID=A0A9X1DB73_9SPHN|nr:hypothetical protein [Sphingobium nicotianae]MBT2186711.1 hypothetical protein [Sphingobium nicotianae]